MRSSRNALLLVVLLASGCSGSTTHDPLIGSWSMTAPSQNSTYLCEFFSEGSWNSIGCGFGSGWPSTWSRLDSGRYLFGFSNGYDCTGTAVFADADNSLTLAVSCATTESRSFSYVRVR